MICKNCGKEVSDTSAFCKFCGNKLEKDDGHMQVLKIHQDKL